MLAIPGIEGEPGMPKFKTKGGKPFEGDKEKKPRPKPEEPLPEAKQPKPVKQRR